MQSLIARIRWRLVGWNVLILGLILVLAGTSVYAAVSRSLLAEVDNNLLARSEQALPVLFPSHREDFGQSGDSTNPVSPADVACTIYEALGINPQKALTTPDGRPVEILDQGETIRELYS